MTWEKKIEFILANTEKIHRTYSIENGWCYLTDKYGNRYKIINSTSIWDIKTIINRIEATTNYSMATVLK